MKRRLLIVGLVAASMITTVTDAIGGERARVLIGGISNTNSLSDFSASQDILRNRRIGLYIHPFAPNITWGAKLTSEIASNFSSVRPMGIELGWQFRESMTLMRIRNVVQHDVSFGTEKTFYDREGRSWEVALPGNKMPDGTRPCIDGRVYRYLVRPNEICTVIVRANVIGAQTAEKDEMISTAKDASLKVVSSLPILAHSRGTMSGYGKVGNENISSERFWRDRGIGGFLYYRSLGVVPTIATVNIDNSDSGNAQSVEDWSLQVQAAKKHGISYIAPVLQPSWWFHMAPQTANFETDPFMVNYRKMAQLGGAVAIDAPPGWVEIWGEDYLDYIKTMIWWSRKNHIKFYFIISPFVKRNNEFYNDTVKIASELIKQNILPDLWIVENYSFSNGEDCHAIGTADDRTHADVVTRCRKGSNRYSYVNSLNNISLYLEKVGTASN